MTRRSKKLSKRVLAALKSIESDRIIVATVLTITRAELAKYGSVGLGFADGHVTTSLPSPPPRDSGKFAQRNLDGWEEKRKDRPKEPRDISSWAPSWNGAGHHLVSRTVQAWPIDSHPAKLLTITADVIQPLKDSAIVRFRVDQPLNRNDINFASDLNFNMRLLKETVGHTSIYPADMSDEDFARIQHVDWELLPRGSSDLVLERLANQTAVDQTRLDVACDRLRILDLLEHDGFIVGRGKFSRYFGAKFGDRLVALESLEYGNAMYVFEENWEQLSQLSRSELIKRRDERVHRIPHISGWQSVIRKILSSSS